MKPIKVICAICTVLALPKLARGENISVTPLSWDFGVVDIGESVRHEFQILSMGPTPLTLNSLVFDDPTSPFFVTGVVLNRPPLPPEDLTWPLGTSVFLPGEFLDLEITYSPVTVGDHSTNLRILSDATPPDHDLDVALFGTGGPANVIPEPSTFVIWGVLGAAGIAYRRRGRRRS